jgi:hypothetical protein
VLRCLSFRKRSIPGELFLQWRPCLGYSNEEVAGPVPVWCASALFDEVRNSIKNRTLRIPSDGESGCDGDVLSIEIPLRGYHYVVVRESCRRDGCECYDAILVHRPAIVVLDLDMTLIHCIEMEMRQRKEIRSAVERCGVRWSHFLSSLDAFEFQQTFDGDDVPAYFLGKLRDGARDILTELTRNPHTVLYMCSIGTKTYVQRVCEQFPAGVFKHVFSREDLEVVCGSSSKRLQKRLLQLDPNMDDEHALIVDDSPDVWAQEDRKHIIAVDKFSFFPSPSDMLLLDYNKLHNRRVRDPTYMKSVLHAIIELIEEVGKMPRRSLSLSHE